MTIPEPPVAPLTDVAPLPPPPPPVFVVPGVGVAVLRAPAPPPPEPPEPPDPPPEAAPPPPPPPYVTDEPDIFDETPAPPDPAVVPLRVPPVLQLLHHRRHKCASCMIPNHHYFLDQRCPSRQYLQYAHHWIMWRNRHRNLQLLRSLWRQWDQRYRRHRRRLL